MQTVQSYSALSILGVVRQKPHEGIVQHTLSMGHNIHKLSYNPTSDVIEVVQYHSKVAHSDPRNKFMYRYLLWVPMTQSFEKVVQTFQRFSSEYRWNKLDNYISGEPVLTEDARYRRISWGIIPDDFGDHEKEQEHVQRFMRLLDYLSKLVRCDAVENMNIKVTTTAEAREESNHETSKTTSGIVPVKHFILQLRKGTREKYEWLDLVMDSVFDTKQTYHISFHWLVASGSKVDAQVQLLQRRCTQYGLNLIPFPQYSRSSSLYLHPVRSNVER